MKRPQWTKRRMPIAKNGYIKCHDCQVARFLGRGRTCRRHR